MSPMVGPVIGPDIVPSISSMIKDAQKKHSHSYCT